MYREIHANAFPQKAQNYITFGLYIQSGEANHTFE